MDDWIKTTPYVLSFMLVAVLILLYQVILVDMMGFSYTKQYGSREGIGASYLSDGRTDR
jgi:hypothetical protein